jgi:cytochrome c-type biogenesis protein CcmH/NrfF
MKRLLLLAAWALVALPLSPAGGADEIEQSRAAYSLSRELMSPFCPGRTLADCPSPSASAVREEIREKINAGVSIAEIRDEMETRFGTAVQGTPGSAIGWALPTIALALGAVGVVVAILRLRRRPLSATEEPIPPELQQEIDRELQERGL